jgi:hypothetical protein
MRAVDKGATALSMPKVGCEHPALRFERMVSSNDHGQNHLTGGLAGVIYHVPPKMPHMPIIC